MLWRLIGPVVTKTHRDTWLVKAGPHILNLGGGGNLRADWLTADTDPRADVYVDLRHKLPFRESVIDGIMLEEVLEHVSLEGALYLLGECRRILKPGGVLRITTPDLEWLNTMRSDPALFLSDPFQVSAAAEAGGEGLPMRVRSLAAFNSTFYSHGHRFIYDAEGLRQLVRHCGFVGVSQTQYQETVSRLGKYDSHADRFRHSPCLSQCLECEKPLAGPEGDVGALTAALGLSERRLGDGQCNR
jgi:SAM-dependent methyltransferase